MNKVKNVIICGLGAIGTIYAARIADAGNINLKIYSMKRESKNIKQILLYLIIRNTPLTI